MRVLMLESDPGTGNDVADDVARAGHVVLRCHEPDHPGFPCRAIADPRACPLRDGVVDVALTVRAAERWTPSESEDGVACALRAGVPLVVAGVAAGNPFAEWATTSAGFANVARVCERAATAPVLRLEEGATERLRDALGGVSQVGCDELRVEVHRSGGRLRAVAEIPEEVSRRDSDLAVTLVVARLRELDPEAAGIDVVVRRVPMGALSGGLRP